MFYRGLVHDILWIDNKGRTFGKMYSIILGAEKANRAMTLKKVIRGLERALIIKHAGYLT